MTAKPELPTNARGIEYFPMKAQDVAKHTILLFHDRICTVLESSKYIHQYSGTVSKHHFKCSTLREGEILEDVVPSDEIMMQISAKV